MLLIPAIDLIDGQCVRLRQGDYADKTVFDSDPVAVAVASLEISDWQAPPSEARTT